MKILILGSSRIIWMPYIRFYLECIDPDEYEIHLICWNRNGLPDEKLDNRITVHEFDFIQKDEVSFIKKIRGFYNYRRYILRLLKKERYDFVIFMQSISGAIIIDKLLFGYKNRYIYDYRDIQTVGKLKLSMLASLMVSYSAITVVSSDGFRAYLSQNKKIHTTHNIQVQDLENPPQPICKTTINLPIVISYWGIVRVKTLNMAIVSSLGNDYRYELHYYGSGEKALEELIKFRDDHGIKNVHFHGRYENCERYKFACNSNILLNCYDRELGHPQSMGNKYYDGIIFRIPQVCTLGSYMGMQAEKAGVGIALDPYGKFFADDLYSYYCNLDHSAFLKNCDVELERVMSEYNEAQNLIRNCLKMMEELDCQ